MRVRNSLLALGASLAMMLPARADDRKAPAAETASVKADPAKAYDALFDQILQNLPDKNRARVDSARVKAMDDHPPAPEPEGGAGKPALEKREQALEKLSPEVKSRVEKAIRDAENRKKDRELEFRE